VSTNGVEPPVTPRPDRRVARTQRLLREALLSLILERGWDAVTVQDICTRADVGRSTFYVHFADKEDLLLSGFALFQGELEQHVADAGDLPLAFLEPLIAHVRTHQPIARALVGKRSGRAAQEGLAKVIRALLEQEVARAAPAGPRRAVALRYLAGAVLEVLVWWLDARKRPTAQALEAQLRALSLPVLDALRTPARR
jgi:AcrR family transcriptional regulator